MTPDIFSHTSEGHADNMIRALQDRPLTVEVVAWIADAARTPMIQEDESFRLEANGALAAWALDNPTRLEALRLEVERCCRFHDPTGVRRAALAWIGLGSHARPM